MISDKRFTRNRYSNLQTVLSRIRLQHTLQYSKNSYEYHDFLPLPGTDYQAAINDYATICTTRCHRAPTQFPLTTPGKTLQMILPLYLILKKIILTSF
jgi:hypothetical protein